MQDKIVKIVLIFYLLFLPVFTLGQEKVDINMASLEELQVITGIGPVYAQRIIDERPFSSLDDLIKVSGIGEKTLQKIKNQGLAYVNLDKVEVRPLPLEGSVGVGLPDPKTEGANETDKKSAKTGTPQINYPGNIIFSKIMPSPEGPDAENEWTVPTNKLRISAYLLQHIS